MYGASPALHAIPQAPAVHVALPLVGTGQAVHSVPHEFTLVSDKHAPLHRWKPALHTKPHAVPSQVTVEFAGGSPHGVHDAPHVAGSVFSAHDEPHAW